MPVIADLQLTISPYTALYTKLVPDSAINAYETVTEGRHAIVLDFNAGGGVYARDIGTVLEWPTNAGTILDVWQPSLVQLPEGIYGRATDWDDSGNPGNKFYQGVTIEAFSFNTAKTFFIQDADTMTLHPLNECPANFANQSFKSFSCAPFVAHSARIISSDGVEWSVFSVHFIYQPWPSSAKNWQTELTSMGLTGWGHVREMNLPYVSTAPINLLLTFDPGAYPANIPLVLPSSAGLQVKTKQTLPANKFKLMGLQASSAASFNLFKEDLELKIGQWGRTDSYKVIKPFGGESRTGAIV